MKYVFRTLLVGCLATVLAGAAMAAATPKPPEDDSTSSGRPVSVTASTRLEYLPAIRVWYDTAGELLVCRYPGETYLHASKRCELKDNKDVRAGWQKLQGLQLEGYELRKVQVNETRNGPSLVLFWDKLSPAKAK